MIIATHEMGFARDIADRVCFLDAGRILEDRDRRNGSSASRPSSGPGSSSTG